MLHYCYGFMIKFTLLTKTILGYFDRQTFNVSIDFDFKYCVQMCTWSQLSSFNRKCCSYSNLFFNADIWTRMNTFKSFSTCDITCWGRASILFFNQQFIDVDELGVFTQVETHLQVAFLILPHHPHTCSITLWKPQVFLQLTFAISYECLKRKFMWAR